MLEQPLVTSSSFLTKYVLSESFFILQAVTEEGHTPESYNFDVESENMKKESSGTNYLLTLSALGPYLF